MPVNTLTTRAGFKLGPLLLETLIKHYFDRIRANALDGKSMTNLRQDELLYDEAFNIVRYFLEAASNHTVEEVQGFANTRTPSPPWVRVIRVVVPMSCCDEAATHVIKALGGEEVTRRLVGGVKWWQVRGVSGVDAQWIAAKKDWREAKRRHKMREQAKNDHVSAPPMSESSSMSAEPPVYEEEMDEMRCILYSHGGGYYFGSVDQERYSIQRHARKMNGRVFAVNYRLAPQYPFPCALQDLVAAYLFLIKPPPGASHRPVKPEHIVIMGDSAGGGISLALLQVIRDAGLPTPAGGVLISPWCDLTHSFPSVHTNTATDVIPVYGLSLQKPSVLWPPPSDELSSSVHASLRSRIRQTLHMPDTSPVLPLPTRDRSGSTATNMPVDVGATTSLPPPDAADNQMISLTTPSGETLTIDQQVHLYCQNSLLPHPLISSALSYLGGLPPLLIIASDKEVLRDEIIYTAHKAAYPERFPIKEETRKLYPSLVGIEARHKPTPVHLQVYDDTAHVLPVLFSFTTPGKYCYRAIATFCKHVTGMSADVHPQSPINGSFPTQGMFFPGAPPEPAVIKKSSIGRLLARQRAATSVPERASQREASESSAASSASAPEDLHTRAPPRRSLSAGISRVIRRHTRPRTADGPAPVLRASPPPLPLSQPPREQSTPASEAGSTGDVGGPRFAGTSAHETAHTAGARFAGDAVVYSETLEFPSMQTKMIRERVSTQGVIRPLEPESELAAFTVPENMIGILSELIIRRYLDGRAKFDKKFHHTIKSVEKHRRQILARAAQDTIKSVAQIQQSLNHPASPAPDATRKGIKEGLMASSGTWSWMLDGNEKPPPSSIVSRRDTEEARRLARIADQSVLQDDHSMSGNNLWTVMVNFLTVSPDKDKAKKEKEKEAEQEDGAEVKTSAAEKRRSRFAQLLSGS